MEKSESEGRDSLIERRCRQRSGGLGKLGLFGIVGLIFSAIIFLFALPDIKRYIRISTM